MSRIENNLTMHHKKPPSDAVTIDFVMDLIWVHKNITSGPGKLRDDILLAIWKLRRARATPGPAIILRAVDCHPVASALKALIMAQSGMNWINPDGCLAFTLSTVAVNESVSRMMPEKATSDNASMENRLLVDLSVYMASISSLIRGLGKHLHPKNNHRLNPFPSISPSELASECENSLRSYGHARVEIVSLSNYKSVEVAVEGILLLSQRLQDRLGRPMFAVVPDSDMSIYGTGLSQIR